MEETNESEKLSDHFVCAVCLDVLYKPIVLVCGHVSCFWCCHYSMDMKGQSHCPLCRHPFRHFPAFCQTLDVLLKKLYPLSYDRKKKQALDDGKRSLEEDDLNPSSTEEKKSNDENCKQVTVDDVLCGACKQLLFRPVVLNCGHVYCETCVTVLEGVIKCEICHGRHPSGFPKVFKELDYFLQEQFPSECELRRNTTQLHKEKPINGNSLTVANNDCSEFSYPPEDNFLQWWSVNHSKFHPAIGCDACGMSPIIGERYRCKDCTERCGYDLCGDCYTCSSDLKVFTGRFNQKHAKDHQFELVKPVISGDVISRLLSGQLAVVTAASRNRSNPIDETSEAASSSLNDDTSVESTEGQNPDDR